MRFYLLTFLLAIGIWVLLAAGQAQGWLDMPPSTPLILLFLAASTAGLFRIMISRINGPAQDFTRAYLAATVLRILVYGLFIWIVIFLDAEHSHGNAAIFLISYLLFTALEVVALFLKINFAKSTPEKEKED